MSIRQNRVLPYRDSSSGPDYPQSASTRIDELRINMVHHAENAIRALVTSRSATLKKIQGHRHEPIAESSFVAITQVWGKIEAIQKKEELSQMCLTPSPVRTALQV